MGRPAAPRFEYHCEGCGGAFTAKAGRRFCSRGCANKVRGRRAVRWATYACEACGAEVTTKPTLARRYRFCASCRNALHGARLDAAQRAKGARQEPVSRSCDRCGRAFTVLACYAPRRYCSNACANLVNAPTMGVGGWRPDLGAYFRSRWEANYARYLRAAGRSYEYEAETFSVGLPDGSVRAYTPDFRVDGAYFVEIKGWMRADRRQSEVIAAAHGQLPLPLHLIGRREYRALERTVASSIEGWEYDGDPLPPHPVRACAVCGDPVRSPKPRTRYCSLRCAGRARQKPP